MKIDRLMTTDGNAVFYDEGFRNVLEDHMSYLRNHPTTQISGVPPAFAYRYEFDFYGLLSELNVPMQLHWVTMRMNDLTSPTDFKLASFSNILIPDGTVVERIKQSHLTSRRVA